MVELQLARVLARQNHVGEAARLVEGLGSLSIFRSDPSFLLRLSSVYLDMLDVRKLRQLAFDPKLTLLNPTVVQKVRIRLALCYDRLGDTKSADKLLKSLMETKVNFHDYTIQEELAALCAKRGDLSGLELIMKHTHRSNMSSTVRARADAGLLLAACQAPSNPEKARTTLLELKQECAGLRCFVAIETLYQRVIEELNKLPAKPN